MVYDVYNYSLHRVYLNQLISVLHGVKHHQAVNHSEIGDIFTTLASCSDRASMAWRLRSAAWRGEVSAAFDVGKVWGDRGFQCEGNDTTWGPQTIAKVVKITPISLWHCGLC